MPIDLTLLRFLLLATLCIDSMWGFTPYVVPAVAPSGAFRLESPAKHGSGRVCLRACLCGFKKWPQFTLCCSLVLHIHKRFSPPSGVGKWTEQRLQGSIKRPVSFVWPPLSTLRGHHMKQTCTRWRSLFVCSSANHTQYYFPHGSVTTL